MDLPVNHFKRRLLAGEPQIGFWLTLADPVAAEIAAGAGFDWLCIDAEHSPTDVRTVMAQLQAVAAYPSSMLVRLKWGDRVVIKQYLDIGVQTLVVPMVERAAQAKDLVAATRYAPEGARGLSNMTRAGRWGRVEGYLKNAHREICLIAQIETATGLENIEAIAAVPGIDGFLIGSGDLAASLGYIGEPRHPKAQATMESAVARMIAAGKPAGMFALDDAMSERYLALGCAFVSVGSDGAMYAAALDALRKRFPKV